MNTEPRISSNTNLLAFSSDGYRRMDEIIPMLANAGFRNLDLNLCEMMNPDSVLNTDDASRYIGKLKELGEQFHVEYVQSHVPYPKDYTALSNEKKKASDKAILKAMRFSEDLNIPHAVIHPIRGSIRDNISYFESLLSAYDGSIMLAIENMETESEIHTPEALIEIAEALSPRAGICLDTGHAHMCGISIPDFIRKTSRYLVATHIADNDGKSDQHLLPFFGTIDWKSTMKAFSDYYSRYLNYECMYFGKSFPKKSGEAIADLAYDIFQLLISLSS